MEEIRNYLLNKDKSWSKGIDLLKKYSKNEKETNFLSNIESPQAMHTNMMLKRLNNILRIALQKGKDEKPEQEESTPIKIKRVHFSKVPGKLSKSKELTNRLLSREWNELDEKETAYFKNDQALFDSKKALLHRNSDIESELKSLHASLPLAEKDDERKEIAEKLVTLKKEQNDNWAKIDNFDQVKEVKKNGKPLKEAELIKKRNNLRSRISKLEKQVFGEPEHKNHNQRVEKLNKAKEELKQVEEELS